MKMAAIRRQAPCRDLFVEGETVTMQARSEMPAGGANGRFARDRQLRGISGYRRSLVR
jgi:hypothetical protein